MSVTVRKRKIKRAEFFFGFLKPRVTPQVPVFNRLFVFFLGKFFIEQAVFLFPQIDASEAVGTTHAIEKKRRIKAVVREISETDFV